MSTVARIVPARDAERVLRADEDVVPEPRLEVALELGQVEVRTRFPGRRRLCALWKKKSAKSKRLAGTGSPSTRTCFSSRCQPRGRTMSVATRGPRR